MQKLRVVLADDHAIVVEGLRRILEPEFEVVGTVRNGEDLVLATQRLNPDVVVVDITMPRMDGIQATRLIRRDNRRVIIVFLTMHAHPAYAKQALEAGGSAYVLKNSAGSELVKAIEEARRGHVYVTPSVARRATEPPPAPAIIPRVPDQTQLTARQLEVLLMVAEGRSAKETAERLHLSPRTVEFHKYRLMEALSLRSTAELTQFAIRQGILAL